MREIVKIGLAVVQANRILLVRKRDTMFYILPGGKPESGEDDISVLHREIDEELGCRIDPESIAYLGSFSDRAAGMASTKVTVRLYAGNLIGNPEPKSEIDQVLWFNPHVEQTLQVAPSLNNSILPFLFTENQNNHQHLLSC